MQCEYQTKDELIAELERLKTINEELRMEKSQIWDMVKVLITKISHEFKTPLNSIIGFTELLKYQINDIKQRDYIDTISMSSQFMLSLIRDILDVTRSQYKPLELSYSIFNVKNVIEDIIKCFNNENILSINYWFTDPLLDYKEKFKELNNRYLGGRENV